MEDGISICNLLVEIGGVKCISGSDFKELLQQSIVELEQKILRSAGDLARNGRDFILLLHEFRSVRSARRAAAAGKKHPAHTFSTFRHVRVCTLDAS